MNLQFINKPPCPGLTDDQLEERRSYITATDAKKVIEGEWQQLWEEKMGYAEPIQQNLPMLIGLAMEELHRYWYSVINEDYQVGKDPDDPLVINDIFGCHTDGWLVSDSGRILRPWEGKAVNPFSKMENLLEFYYPQLQHIMLCTDANDIEFSVIFLNNRLEHQTVQRDEPWLSAYTERAEQFWKFVKAKQRPPEVELDEVAIPYEQRKVVYAQNRHDLAKFVSLGKIWTANKRAAKNFNDADKELKDQIAGMSDTRCVFTDDIYITIAENGSRRIYPIGDKKHKQLMAESDGS